jgi:hypothetical protein
MAWEIEGTDEFAAWYGILTDAEQQNVAFAIGYLETSGPGLGRPFVDTVKGSRHAHMKELRPRSGNLRVFSAFDPRRTAILLIGGDKTNHWHSFYETMIPIADDLFDAYLGELRAEGLLDGT